MQPMVTSGAPGIPGTLGGRVRFFRRKAGLSQRELAALSGVSDTRISEIERGENPTVDAVLRLQAALEIESIEQLLGDLPPLPSSSIGRRLLNGGGHTDAA